MSVHADDVFFKLLANAADSDSPEMNVNGASTPVNFDVTPPAGDLSRCTIRRLCVAILATAIRPEWFGSVDVRTAGVGLRMVVVDADDNEVLDFLDGQTIKSNAEWPLLAGVDNPTTAPVGAGDDSFAVRWTLSNALDGKPLTLRPGERLRAIVADNLTGLTLFRIMAQGTR
jgi:hypothetical protein